MKGNCIKNVRKPKKEYRNVRTKFSAGNTADNE